MENIILPLRRTYMNPRGSSASTFVPSASRHPTWIQWIRPERLFAPEVGAKLPCRWRERWRRWRTGERLRKIAKINIYRVQRKVGKNGEPEKGKERKRTIRKKTGSVRSWMGERREMEDLVRVARDRDEAKARGSYTSISEYWNNSNAEYPDVYTSRRVYIHRDIRTIARNKTFFAMLAAPSIFPSLSSHKEGKAR